MTPLKEAEQEWVVNTTPHCKDHFYENGKWAWTDEFRKRDQAIALINWECDDIEIKKLEKLPDSNKGAADSLVKLLKELADKYKIRIFCRVKPYTPDPPWSDDERVPTLQKLKNWYQQHGFHFSFTSGNPYPMAWYPDIPAEYIEQV
jgi:hypothetical protein